MDWETASLLAFVLIFSMWATSPTHDHNYTVIDGTKHYFITEEIQNTTSNFDQLTNSIFIKFDDPWAINVITAMLIAGIFASLTKPVRDYLKIKFRILQNTPAPHHLTNQNQFTILVKDKILSYHNSCLSEKFKPKS